MCCRQYKEVYTSLSKLLHCAEVLPAVRGCENESTCVRKYFPLYAELNTGLQRSGICAEVLPRYTQLGETSIHCSCMCASVVPKQNAVVCVADNCSQEECCA